MGEIPSVGVFLKVLVCIYLSFGENYGKLRKARSTSAIKNWYRDLPSTRFKRKTAPAMVEPRVSEKISRCHARLGIESGTFHLPVLNAEPLKGGAFLVGPRQWWGIPFERTLNWASLCSIWCLIERNVTCMLSTNLNHENGFDSTLFNQNYN